MDLWKEYAIDPQLFRNFHLGHQIVAGIGFEKGRLVGAVPRKWLRSVRDIARENYRPVEILRMVDSLKSIEKAIVKRALPEIPGLSWQEEVLQSHGARPFTAIVSSTPLPHALALDGSIGVGMQPLWEDVGSASVSRTAESLLCALKPLLSKAREIIFVDAYFNPSDERWLRPLAKLFSCLERNGSIERLEIHALNRVIKGSPEWVPGAFTRNSGARLPPLLPSDLKVEAHLWALRPDSPLFHERAIVTDLGGLVIDPGIDDGRPEENYTLRLMRLSEVRAYLDRYVPHTSPFDLCEKASCEGSLSPGSAE